MLPDLAAVSDDAQRALAETLRAAARKAVDGGAAGAMAQVINVGALIWMRTTVNYQYRHGKTTTEAFRFLYNDGGRGLGGILRFYRGIGPALLQAPLARFGDTAANAGTLTLLDSLDATRDAPVWAKTAAASVAAGGFRILLMPIDACKTVMQVEGAQGMTLLRAKIAASGPRVLWAGALGSAGATLVGHYPWCAPLAAGQEIKHAALTWHHAQVPGVQLAQRLPADVRPQDGACRLPGPQRRHRVCGICRE